MSSPSTLQKQQLVLSLLAEGSTASAAADAAGVHRNTISNWRRNDARFRDHWNEAQFDQAMHWRDQMQALGDIAVSALRTVLEDPQTSPSVRLKAALAVLHMLTKPVPQLQNPAQKDSAATSEEMHNNAQESAASTPVSPTAATSCAAPAQPCTTTPAQPAAEELNQLFACYSGLTEAYAVHRNGPISPESVVLRQGSAVHV